MIKGNAFNIIYNKIFIWESDRFLIKTLRILNLTAIILLLSCLLASGKGFTQRVTLSEKNVSLDKVFKEIHKQTGYYFLCNEDWLQKNNKISINVSNASIEEVLDICFKDQPFTYEIIEKTIAIKQKQNEDNSLSEASTAPIPIDISGKVISKNGYSLPGATVALKGSNKGTITNENGEFTLYKIDDALDIVLVVSFIGYKTKEIEIKGETFITIILEEEIGELEEVEVVATGYQVIPKERATGSFQLVNNERYNRTSEPDIITRLNGVATGMVFNPKAISGEALQTLVIRGISTIGGNMAPLIVLDNIPYDGDINNINPNDVESITILKDAAAASIWGTRAGNGVIVITTKKGSYNQPLQVSFNSNLSMSQKPDLNSLPYLKSSDYIDAEKELFQLGVYDSKIDDRTTFTLITPVVELLAQARDGTITEDEANKQIDAMRKYSFYDDLLEHMLQKPFHQQYALNLRRGVKDINYLFSAGYDKGMGENIGSENNRLTLRSYVALKLFKNFELQTSIQYAENNDEIKNTLKYTQPASSSISRYYPYARLVDDSGNPVVLGRDYRVAFADSAGENRQLNWQYNPIKDVNESYMRTKSQDILLNLGGVYTINPIFSAQVKYQYEKNMSQNKRYYSPESYYARNMINDYTQMENGNMVRPVPLGGCFDQSYGDFISHTLRGQINADKTWNEKHQLTGIAGVEIRENRSSFISAATTYGYNEELLEYKLVDFGTAYRVFDGQSKIILNAQEFSENLYRYTSVYANAAYSYDYRYTLTLSGRKDASNLFGVKSNQKGTPLWSAGAGWIISKEGFYRSNILPFLKLRLTYGYSGNVINNESGKARLKYWPFSSYSTLPTAYVINPPNPELRWEKTGILNLAIDFALINNILSGSLEYYDKRSTDLFTPCNMDITSGFYYVQRNNAEVHGNGLELVLNANILKDPVGWETGFLFSFNL
ncbi:MAG: SusC/RagA family TonB-linked outer membrane protein [Salinivirgaceae bacterium]|nr:SusC/RagA family TonB-linked outer membrane protein [Salinivirgaceae bacterium]